MEKAQTRSNTGGSLLQNIVAGYGQRRSQFPMRSYLLFLSFYNLALLSLVFKGKRANYKDGARTSPQDLLLLGIATHKLSRIITKDVVTAPIRAPFTRYNELLGYGEVQESGRGHGVREVIGDLLSCNYCADPWVALAFAYGLDLIPDQTRFLMKFFSSIALADFSHVLYETIRTRANVLTLHEERLEERKEKKAA